MRININMPQVGQDIKYARLIEWHVKTGDRVNEGDILATVESDKASFEVESHTQGTIVDLLYDIGEEAEVFTPILTIEDGKEPSTIQSSVPGIEHVRSTAAPFKNPSFTKYEKNPGLKVFVSPAARRVAREHQVELASIKGSGPNGRIVKRDVLMCGEAKPDKIRISPLAREIISETGIDPVYVNGSGENAKIVKKDVENIKLYPKSQKLTAQPGEKVIRFDKTKKRIAERLTSSKQTIPHYYVFSEVNFAKLFETKAACLQKTGEKISINDLILKKTAETLLKFPNLNSHVDDEKMIIKSEINLGMAVSTPFGLLVPVVPNADKLTLEEIHRISAKNAADARRGINNSLARSTFTVTNLGMHGITGFLPIINPPECAILSVGSAHKKAVVSSGRIEIADVAVIGLSCDHRAVDGAEAAAFVYQLKAELENYEW
jgi:pyruvate dehydrogenase E2 component (dihydrolipoamide acetyltransferase)